jgi:hypothetical protein
LNNAPSGDPDGAFDLAGELAWFASWVGGAGRSRREDHAKKINTSGKAKMGLSTDVVDRGAAEPVRNPV